MTCTTHPISSTHQAATPGNGRLHPEAAEAVKRNHRYSRKVQYGRLKNLEMCQAIEQYMTDELGIQLKDVYQRGRDGFYEQLVDMETGEYLDEYEGLLDAYYNLKRPTPFIQAVFEDVTGLKVVQTIGGCYSRHKMDHIWNWRKSQMIRKVWRTVLQADRLHEKYRPMHLVLTVPHKGGLWMGKRYYGKEIVKYYNMLRKYPMFKKAIYGGEYGTETTWSPENGLHTHIHSLIFVYNNVSINQLRNDINEVWQRLTGGNAYLETLYVYRRDEAGNWITDLREAQIIRGDSEEFTYRDAMECRKKFYLDNRNPWYKSLTDDEKLEAYTNGILECIKYHFKNESFKNEHGHYDMEFLKEILRESKNLRMYGKFGGFYGDRRLNYNETFTESDLDNEPVDYDHYDLMYFTETGQPVYYWDEEAHQASLDYFMAELPELEKVSFADLMAIPSRDPNPTDVFSTCVLPDGSVEETLCNGYRYIIRNGQHEPVEPDWDEDLNSDINAGLAHLVNPFTGQASTQTDYTLYLVHAEKMEFTINPLKRSCYMNPGDPGKYFKLIQTKPLKFIMQSIFKRRFHQILEYDDIGRYYAYDHTKRTRFN